MIITCGCGETVELQDSWYNICLCGQGYNGGGQRLEPPALWGEETGEAFDDSGNDIAGGAL
jgi:hypothetical protein